jgi:hypothetical protein
MSGYLVTNGQSSFLERREYDGVYDFSAGMASLDYAAVFTRPAAQLMAAHFRLHGVPSAEAISDWRGREAQIGLDAIRGVVARGAA